MTTHTLPTIPAGAFDKAVALITTAIAEGRVPPSVASWRELNNYMDVEECLAQVLPTEEAPFEEASFKNFYMLSAVLDAWLAEASEWQRHSEPRAEVAPWVEAE